MRLVVTLGLMLVILALARHAPAGAESLAGTDGNPPEGCRRYAIVGRAWAATGCPNGTRRGSPGRRPSGNGGGQQDGQLEVSAQCTSTPEVTTIRNVGDTDVFVERIVSPDTGQGQVPLSYVINELVPAGDELLIATGQGAPEGRQRPIYANEDVDIEEVIVETDAGDFEGGCVEAG